MLRDTLVVKTMKIQSLKSVPNCTKNSFSILLENRECMKEIAETAAALQLAIIATKNYESDKEFFDAHNFNLDQVNLNVDALIFRAVLALGSALREMPSLAEMILEKREKQNATPSEQA